MFDYKLELRKNNYQKANVKLLEARDNFRMSLRKQKIDEFISQKREKLLGYQIEDKKELEINPGKLKLNDELKNKSIKNRKEYMDFILNLITKNENEEFDHIKLGIYLLRVFVTKGNIFHIAYYIDSGIFKILNSLLNLFISDQQIVFEILWIFTNISCNENSPEIIEFVTFKFIQNYSLIFEIYEHKSLYIFEQLIWHLGNVVSGNAETRVELIKSGLFTKILNLFNQEKLNENLVKISCWFINNSLQCKIEMTQELLSQCVTIILTYIYTNDKEIVNDCIWGLSFASGTNYSSVINMIVESKICEHIIRNEKLLKFNLILPSIRILGNILSNENKYVDYLIDIGCIPFLEKFLTHNHPNIRKENLWALSNIAAGSQLHIKALINSGVIFKIFAMTTDDDLEVIREAIWLIGNAINGGNIETSLMLNDINIIDTLISVLKNNSELTCLKLTLECLITLFKQGENIYSGYNYNTKIFQDKGGCDALENIQFHKNNDIFNIVNFILDKFFAKKNTN